MDEKVTKSNLLSNKLQFVLTLMAFLAPLFYLIGLGFNNGLLATYGIPSDTFNFSTQDIYFSAYIAIAYLLLGLSDWIQSLLQPSTLYWLIPVLIVVFYLFFKWKHIRHNTVIQKIHLLFEGLFKKLHPDKNDLTLAVVMTTFTAYLILLVFALFSFWIIPYIVGYEPARNIANERISFFQENGCQFKDDNRWSNCRILQSNEGEYLYEGVLVANSGSKIAFFLESGALVAEVPEGAVILNKLRIIEPEKSK